MTSAPIPLPTLPVFTVFEDVADQAKYQSLPDGWVLAVADIVSSGAALAAGKYKLVNMAGAAVISSVLNGLGQNEYPFVFGGDGAVVAVPPEGVDRARDALSAVGRWVEEELGLNLRTAIVPLADIRLAGLEVLVARYQVSDEMRFAMFAGGGVAWAEAQMKAGLFAVAKAPPGTRPDLTGLSCRWDPVPARRGQILSIIASPGAADDPAAFRALVADVVAMANAGGGGHPLPSQGPRPRLSFGGMDAEARAMVASGQRWKAKLGIMAAIVLSTILHRLNLRLGGFSMRDYARDVAANTDFRKFDDGLKMTIDIDADGAAAIESRLEQASQAGICRYGLHRQASALVTCIVPSPMTRDHMHFVDGAGGGYAQAALALKAKP